MTFGIALLLASGSVAASAQADTVFTVGQQIEFKTALGWRPCTVKEPGGAERLARADCAPFATPTYTYPAAEESFNAAGSMDVRMPGSCETTSVNLVTRHIRGCVAAAPPPAAPAPAPAAPPPVEPAPPPTAR